MLTAESHYCTCLYRHLPRISPALFLAVSVCHALPESHYTASWCAEMGGQAEVTMPDGSRADCVTDTHAVEVERAAKFKDSVGQVLHYSRITGKRPLILLLLSNESDKRKASALCKLIKSFHIPIEVVIWNVKNSQRLLLDPDCRSLVVHGQD